MKLYALSALAACQTFFTWIPARNSHELLSRHFSTWYGRCGETLCTARMKGAPSCYRYTGIEMENTSPNERLTPGQSQTPAISPPIAIVHQGPEISGDLIDNQQPRATPPQGEKVKRRYYIPVKAKFLISTTLSCVWLYASWLLAQNWLAELAHVTGYFPGVLIIFFVALLPGFLNVHIISSVVLDRPPNLRLDLNFPKISLLVAAYNEEENIAETIRGIKNQDYPGKIEIIVVDDGSTDNTIGLLRSYNLSNLKIVQANHGGKARALNKGLKHVTQDIVVCIDADTFLHPQACSTFMTRLQEWDYFTGIASAKRQQSLYQGTLVAQGAFSAFRTKLVRAHHGWPSVIGEDIVLTWSLISSGWRIGFEPTAIGFTIAPLTFKGFYRQRKRWARGMIEGLKQHGHLVWKSSRLSAFFVGIDFIIPFIDLFYAFVFLPGVVLALFGNYNIASTISA